MVNKRIDMTNWQLPQTAHDQREMERGMTDLERYFQERDHPKPVMYTPPATKQDVEVAPASVITLDMKRGFAVVGFLTACYCAVTVVESAAVAGVFAGSLAGIASIAPWAISGLFVISLIGSMFSGGNEPKRTAPGAIHQNQNIVVNTTINVGGSQNAKQ